MRDKLGIITLNGYFNYGNRLQNYALTKILEKKGFDVYTLWHKTKIDILKDIIKSNLIFIKKYRRHRNFYKFSKQNMKEIIWIDKKVNKFNYFVVGSDQVWNYKLMDKDKTWFYPKEYQKTISFAASFGTSTFSETLKDKFCKMIDLYDAISVREQSGKKILKNLNYRKEVFTLIDPTLILKRSEWNAVAKKPRKGVPNKYVFVYFLGEILEKYNDEINKFAKENDCEIINILNKESYYYECGPREFLYLIENATMICTDSFHACVFSFIFESPFVVFKRTGDGISNDMYTRLDNLLNVFKLNNREYDGKSINANYLKVDYSEGKKVLEVEILKCNYFLDNYLKKS